MDVLAAPHAAPRSRAAAVRGRQRPRARGGRRSLAFSQYVLHLDGPVPDNIANLVGIALGTALRYVGYKRWVFTGEQDEVASPDERAADEAAVALAVQPVVPFGAVVAADELHEQHQHEHESH